MEAGHEHYREKLQYAWLDKPALGKLGITLEMIFLIGILILAVISRFYLIEPRVMSHDETIHVYHNSWSLFTGQGYRHDPLSHGPFQTHVVALSYFLFGDSDTSARIPAVLFSIATVLFVWNFRRYLGRAGALAAMVLMLISPYMLYYGRYVRNESFAAFFGVVTIWAMLRYLETGKARYTYWLTAAIVLHFTAKETAFIYTAQALLFLGVYFIYNITVKPWPNNKWFTGFLISLLISFILLGGMGAVFILHRQATGLSATETVTPAIPGQTAIDTPTAAASPLLIVLAVLLLVAVIIGLVFLIRGYSWERLRKERSFSLLVLIGTFALPQLSAFPVKLMGWDIPTNAAEVQQFTQNGQYWQIAIFFIPMLLLSIAIGLIWNWRLWSVNAAIFYSLFTIFYTTVFTNGAGFFTGMIGSLGYWLEQQGVNRGSQPWYYYIGVQVPVYEYLPALASLFGLVLIAYRTIKGVIKPAKLDEPGEIESPTSVSDTPDNEVLAGPADNGYEKPPVLALLSFWVITSILAYTIAGEKMPWLTVHMAWPMVLLGGWTIGQVIEATDWTIFRERRGWLLLTLLLVFLVSGLGALASLLGTNPPFQGKELEQLQATSTFLLSLLMAVASGAGLVYLANSWPQSHLFRVFLLTIFGGLAILTARTAYQSSYINYDNANELLVYAHSAPGVKTVMTQIEEISKRTTDGLGLGIGHDGEYPFWWYLRNYTNTRYYGANPTRSLREMPIIIVGENNFGKIEPVVRNNYQQFDYIRLWWPNQDYFGLTWERIGSDLANPAMRNALFQIWLNRDYSKYGEVTGKDLSLTNWSPSSRMRLYVRNDIVSQIWNYGVSPVAAEEITDPYEGKQILSVPDISFGSPGNQAGQFQRPRDLEVAADGSLYIVDTDNHRVQHVAADGTPLHTWGSFADAIAGDAAGGTFNQPWGIGIAPDGSVFVADTWNHRVQKFTADGEFIKMWGYFGQAETPDAFWGPRDIAVDSQGRVFITDTGNKRIVIFDSDGNYLSQFGTAGMTAGEFDEPIGIDIDSTGRVYLVDTWNQRIQVFEEMDVNVFTAVNSWDVAGWYGQSLENKPYLSVDAKGFVYVTDPEGYRILWFTNSGGIVAYWGDYSTGLDGFSLPASVAVDPAGGVWVSDAGNSRILHFTLPGEEQE